MSPKTKLPDLPKTTADKLVALKGKNPDEFHALIKALRLEGWPLRAIAAPLAVSRTAIMDWDKKCPQDAALPEVPELPLPEPKDRVNSAKKYDITEGEKKRLRDLTESASKVRRYTDQNAASRQDALELEKLLIEYSDGGLSRTQLARYCGVSDSAIKQRLRKHQ